MRLSSRRPSSLLLAAALVGALTACAGGGGTTAGQVVTGRGQGDLSGGIKVLLPTGAVTVAVGKPSGADVAADDARDGQDHAPPDGGSFIQVSWRHDPFAWSTTRAGVMARFPQPADFVLVVDGKRSDLGSPYRVASEQGTTDSGIETQWVAVRESPNDVKEVSLEVGYDGQTQTFDTASGQGDQGVAAALYDLTDAPRPACPADGWQVTGPQTAGLRVTVDCTVDTLQPLPYLPKLGWTTAGRTWVVAAMHGVVGDVHAGRATYAVQSARASVSLDGAQPTDDQGVLGPIDEEATGGAWSGTYAFDAASGATPRLDIALDCVLRKRSGPGPQTLEVRLLSPLGR